jgi:hypothetical protein
MKTDWTFDFSGAPTTAAASPATQTASNMLSAPQSNNTNSENGSFETPVLSVSDRKRKKY